MHTYCGIRYSRPAGLFSLGRLNVSRIRLRRSRLREAPADFGLECLATVCMSHPGYNMFEIRSSVQHDLGE